MYKNKLFEILMNNPEAAVTLLSRFYPFDGILIDKFRDVLDFNELSSSAYVKWDSTLIEKLDAEWIWEGRAGGGLSRNKSLPWSESFIEKYKDKWEWDGLFNNRSLPWTEAFIKKYKNKWAYCEGIAGVVLNESLPWDETLIEMFIPYDIYPYENITKVHELIKKLNPSQVQDILLLKPIDSPKRTRVRG
jgi:hypothetical protein